MISPIGIIDTGYDLDSGYVYAKFITGNIVLIDCDEVEKLYTDNMYESVGGKVILPSLGKDFFTSVGKQFFT